MTEKMAVCQNHTHHTFVLRKDWQSHLQRERLTTLRFRHPVVTIQILFLFFYFSTFCYLRMIFFFCLILMISASLSSWCRLIRTIGGVMNCKDDGRQNLSCFVTFHVRWLFSFYSSDYSILKYKHLLQKFDRNELIVCVIICMYIACRAQIFM